MRAQDKVVIVSGGAGGLGASTATRLTQEGAKVVLTDLSEEALERVARPIGADAVRHDVTSEEDWSRVVAATIERHGRIDGLVHCAGIEGNRERTGIDTPLSEWNKVLAVNLTSSFLAGRAVMPAMREQGEGSIVLLSSVVGTIAAKTGLPYGASKAGVIALARAFAAIGWQDGTRVRSNAVLPGSISTGMTERLYEDMAKRSGLTRDQIDAKLKEMIPFGESGRPDDIASGILYLISDESRYVTGTSMVIDGGWTVIEEP